MARQIVKLNRRAGQVSRSDAHRVGLNGWIEARLRWTLRQTLVLFGVLVLSLTCSYAGAQTYDWSSIKECQCGLGASVVKNQSFGVLFSKRTSKDDSDIGFSIDFSGVNRIAFQVDSVFYNHTNNTMRVEKNQFRFAEAKQFIDLAHSYNTSVDLLISSENGKDVPLSEYRPPSAGEVVILANDIVNMLSENHFDGVTIDLPHLFRNDLVSYRRLVQEVIKGLKNQSGGPEISIDVILSDSDLPRANWGTAEYDTTQQENARLLMRLLDERLFSNPSDEVQNRLLIRTALGEKKDLGKSCGVIAGPDITGSLVYAYDERGAVLKSFPKDHVYPLVSREDVEKQFSSVKDLQMCRREFFNRFIVNRGYQGLAFEDIEAPPAKITALGKWYPTADHSEAAGETASTAPGGDAAPAESDDKGWADLAFFRPIANFESMGFLKWFQETYAPQSCQRICPYQIVLLNIAFGILVVLILFLLVSQIVYRANNLFKKVSIYCYIGFLLIALVIQFIALCQVKYEIIRNWTFIISLAIMLISWLVHYYYRMRRGSFP